MADIIIYTDNTWNPIGELKHYAVDIDIGKDNDFEIKVNIKNNCMKHNSIWFIDGEELGGIVDDVVINTESKIISYQGRTWRGILDAKIIEPDSGEDYYILSGDANTIIQTLIDRFSLSDLFMAPDYDSGFAFSDYQFNRYVTGLSGLKKMLSSVGARLKIAWSNTEEKVVIEAVAAEDLSDTYEFLDDYGIAITLTQTKSGVNHLICLGQGDLAERTVIHLYVDANGNITDTQYYTGTAEIAETYDYSLAEDEDELYSSGVERLEDLRSTDSISASLARNDVDLDVGDIIAGKNRETGVSISAEITSKIVKIENGRRTQTYEIGG